MTRFTERDKGTNQEGGKEKERRRKREGRKGGGCDGDTVGGH